MYYNAPEMWVARSARPVPSIMWEGYRRHTGPEFHKPVNEFQ